MDNESKEMFRQLFAKLDSMDAKLDKVEVRLDNVESKLDNVESRLDNVESKLDNVESRLDNAESKLDKTEGRLNNLAGGQAEIKLLIYRMDRKISDTYNLALDAWGQGVENRELIKMKA